MSQVCDQHQKKPAAIYVQCIGCELDRLQAEVKRLTKERNDHGPEGRNYTNGQYVELLMKYEAMREALEQLIEVYENRQRSATTLLDDPNTQMEQRTPVQGKKEVFRVILLELDTILKGEKEH
ncbi:hypothetical protein, partial [Paenibacillus ehimensis]